jgi:hypothetical protein
MTEFDQFLRAEINSRVRRRAWSGGEGYSLVWSRAYQRLREECGFAPPEDVKNRLDAVHAAGHLETLWHVVKKFE